jgi:branched-chain amino acid transport system substrate-binding protein
MKKTWIGLVVLVILAIILSFLFINQENGSDLKIGAVMPLTGDPATYGVPVQEGMKFALSEINNKGGVNGKKLKIIFEDNLGEPKTAVAAFKKLIDTDKVPIILGPLTSGASMATAPIAEKRKVVQLSTIAGTMELKHAGDYVFRVFASDELQGKALVDKAADVFKVRNAAIIFINNAYGDGIRQVIEERSKERGIKIVATESFNEGDKDFRTQLTKIKDAKPDLVFALSYWKEGALMLVQAKELGIDTTFLGGDAWFGPVYETAGEAVDLLAFTNMAFGEEYKHHPKMQQFINSYAQKYGKEADVYAATGYDAVYLAANAIEKQGYNAESIKQALYNTKDFIGALGNITYDEYGDNVGAEFDLYVIRNGETLRYSEINQE